MFFTQLKTKNLKGNLLEDTVAMYLNQIIPKYGAFAFTCDTAKAGADFIVSSINRKIVIEVGAGKKSPVKCKILLLKLMAIMGW